jgi:hypothetical protein
VRVHQLPIGFRRSHDWASLQQYTNYDVAVPVKAPTPDAAAGLAKVIGGAAAQAHWQSGGMEPAH